MLRRNWRTERKYIRLWNIVTKWDFSEAAFGKKCNEEAAKAELINFFEILRRCRPEKKLNLGLRTGYYSFLINFIPLAIALDSGKYALACHELQTLLAYEPVLQERIYWNLLRLYKEYLLQ